MTDENDLEWKMFLMRDPTGSGPVYSGDWKHDDAKWTSCGSACKNAVPLGVDPTASSFYNKGIFTVPTSTWVNGACFKWGYIAHVRDYLTVND